MDRNRHYKPVAFSIVLLLCALACDAKSFGQTKEAAAPNALTLGLVSATHEKEIEGRFRDFARYAARRVSSAMDVEGRVLLAPTATRKDLNPTVVKRLREVLLSMHEDDEGRKILQADGTTKFDLLPGGEEMMRRKLVELFRPR
jgi:ABC-type phosphate/phosphonate transport system substrate-binding protein